MRKISKKIKEYAKEIFIRGRTEMGVAWLMLIIGLVFGWAIKKC